jgi:hypothetical protein
MSIQPPTKKMIFHIEVPGIHADEYAQRAADLVADYADVSTVRPSAALLEVVEEDIALNVGLTLIANPGDKCQGSEFGVMAFAAEIVGVQVVDR